MARGNLNDHHAFEADTETLSLGLRTVRCDVIMHHHGQNLRHFPDSVPLLAGVTLSTSQISTLIKLFLFDLSYNKLTGSIPRSVS